MQKVTKYTIFKTKWGYFGLAGTTRLSSSKSEDSLLRTCLPLSNPENVKSHLLTYLTTFIRRPWGGVKIISESPQFEKRFFKTVQDQITAYFACPERSRRKGACVNFSTDIPIVLDGLSDFCSSVLTACRDIRFGQVVSYSGLAKKMGRPAASRAVGNALAKNPLPLIIPCHRIIRSDGQLGEFSAPGGMSTKAKLLKHERLSLRRWKSE